MSVLPYMALLSSLEETPATSVGVSGRLQRSRVETVVGQGYVKLLMRGGSSGVENTVRCIFTGFFFGHALIPEVEIDFLLGRCNGEPE